MNKVEAERILGIKEDPYTKVILKQCYKVAVKGAHPDCGGSHEQMVQVNEAHSYLLSYFKYQSSVSLSAQPATSNFTNYYYNRPKTTEEQRKETEAKVREACARRAGEEARRASEKMKETARATAYTTEAFKDFAKAYEDFTYWTAQEGGTSAQQWAKVSQVVDEVEKETFASQTATEASVRTNDVENGESEPEADQDQSIFAWLGLGIRVAFFIFAIVCFISIGSWDFIANFGTFHFMDYWAGDFFSFFFCIGLVLCAGANLLTGLATDWITIFIAVIYNVFQKKSA